MSDGIILLTILLISVIAFCFMYICYQIYNTLNKSKNNIKYICVTKYGVRTIEAKKFSDAIQEAYDISGYDDVLIMIIENK